MAVCQGEYQCGQCENGQVGTAQIGFHSTKHERRDSQILKAGPPVASILQLLASSPVPDALSQSLHDASLELECRVELGEFDDLDDMQLNDLRALSYRLAQWAAMAQTLEQRLYASPPHTIGHGEAAASPGTFGHTFRH